MGRAALALAGAAVLAASACRKDDARAEGPRLALDDPRRQALVVLEVGEEKATNADFLKYVRATVGETWADLSPEGASRLFDDFVERKLIVWKARGKGVALTEDERTGFRTRLRAAMGDDGIREAQTAPDPEALEEALLVEKFLGLEIPAVPVTDEEVAAEYGRRKADYLQPERVEVSQILLSAEGRATEIRNRLKEEGEEEFRLAARSESVGPEAARGGAMGTFSPGQLPPELEKVIFALKAGEVSPVVVSSYGYHIFRLDRRTDFRLLTAAEAAPLVRARLLEERGTAAVAAYLAELKSSLDWSVRVENLPFSYQRINP
jgi:hypothetical protein